jgi:DNA-binding transcriptional MerR regulator
MEYRIEQLARTAGVAVDTVRFYQGQRLLPPPRREGRLTWYDESHLERLRRVRALQQRGFSLAVIRRFLNGELEPSDEALVAAVNAPQAVGETITLEEIATRSGVAVPILRALEQAGLILAMGPPGPDGEARYPASDLDALATGMRLLEAGIPLTELLALAAEHVEATDRTAARAVDLFDHHVRERLQAGGGDGAGELLLERFTELLEASASLVEHHFKRSLLRAANERIERREQAVGGT